jgi:hypothetical protein
MRTYKVKYAIEYECVVMIPEETEEDDNLYGEDFLLEDRLTDIDIPQGGINDSRYLADSFEVTSTEEIFPVE